MLKAGPKFEVVAANDLGDATLATPVFAGGRVAPAHGAVSCTASVRKTTEQGPSPKAAPCPRNHPVSESWSSR